LKLIDELSKLKRLLRLWQREMSWNACFKIAWVSLLNQNSKNKFSVKIKNRTYQLRHGMAFMSYICRQIYMS
jgi:hypothetical protein